MGRLDIQQVFNAESKILSMLLNLYQRFTKAELNQNGFEIAFVDNNFLSYLTDQITDSDFKKRIKESFKNNKIIPVLNSFVFYEFVKGLTSIDLNNGDLLAKKRQVAQFLDELTAYWILDYEKILAFEFLHIEANILKEADKFYKVFCKSPFAIMSGTKPFAVKSSLSYPCDKVMHFIYSPYSDSSDELKNPVSSWAEYFEHVFKDISCIDELKKILDEYLNFEEKAFKRKKELQKSKEIIRLERIKLSIKPFVGCHYLPSHPSYIEEKAQRINVQMVADFRCSDLLNYAPLYSIYEHFYWDTLKNWDVQKKKEKKIRDILDRLHTHLALSYCDYFLTCDGPIKQTSRMIRQRLGLSSSFLEYEKNPFSFIK